MDASAISEPEVTGINSGRVARHASLYMVAQIVSWAATFASISILPRMLGEDLMGKWGAAELVRFSVGVIFGFGLEPFLIRKIGRREAGYQGAIQNSLGLRLAIMPIVAIACVISFLPIIHKAGSIESVDQYRMLATANTILCCGSLISSLCLAVLNGMEEARKLTVFTIANALVALALIPIYQWLGFHKFVVTTVLVNLLLFGIQFWTVQKLIPLIPKFQFPVWKLIILGGVPFVANLIVLQFYDTTTIFTLKHLMNDAAVGNLRQAQRLTGTMLFIPTALGMALLPSLSRLNDADPEELRRVQSRVFSLLIVLAMPIVITMMVLATPACHALYGPTKFAAVPGALRIYSIALIPLYIVSTMYQFLVARGKNGLWVWFLVVSIAVNVVCNFSFIPFAQAHFQNGVLGAAASTMVAETFSAVCAIALLGGGIFTRESVGRLARAFVAAIAMGAAMWTLRGGFLLIPAVVGMLVYAMICWKLRVFEPEEEAKLCELFQRKLLGKLRKRS